MELAVPLETYFGKTFDYFDPISEHFTPFAGQSNFGKTISCYIPFSSENLTVRPYNKPYETQKNKYRKYLITLVNIKKEVQPLLERNLPNLLANAIMFYYQAQRLKPYPDSVRNWGKRDTVSYLSSDSSDSSLDESLDFDFLIT